MLHGTSLMIPSQVYCAPMERSISRLRFVYKHLAPLERKPTVDKN